MNKLEDTIKLKKGIGKVLPLFHKEDLGYHVDKILKDYDDIRTAVEERPYLRSYLEEEVKKSLAEYKWDIYGAKAVDSLDKITSVIELGSTVFGGVGEEGVKLATEPVEWAAKGLYTVYYVAHSGDLAAIPYFTAAELASLIPWVGEAVDWADLYVNKTTKYMRKKAVENFRKAA